MMTFANSVYSTLKKKGLHNWGFLNLKQSDFDFNDMDFDTLEEIDPDWFLEVLEE
jgi:hypothetical protein